VSGVVVVAKDGKTLFAKSYGSADHETKRPIDLDTRFSIGSVTKTLTAVAVMQLVERGVLRTEDRVAEHMHDLPPAWSAITVHHLLTHSSGIPSYTDDGALMDERERPHTAAEILLRVRRKKLLFSPGVQFSYSNTNYFLLGMLLERVARMPYDAFLRASVLGPAAMARTTSSPDGANDAIGYTANDDDRLERARKADPSFAFAAGSLWSTANDLLSFDRALAKDTLLSPAYEDRLFTPNKRGYGCGWECSRVAGRDVVSHTGSTDGFSAYFARVPDEKLVVIVLLNADAFRGDGVEAEEVGLPALEMALGGERALPPVERRAVAVDPALAARVAAEYAPARGDGGPIALLTQKSGLFVKLAGPPMRLFSGEDGTLFPKQPGVELVLGPDGGELTLRSEGHSERYVRRP
jgi:CubicO group peptidase (beta-lactamase class C family)